jgi:hypothetical protein
MPEPLSTPPPPLVPSTAAVDAAARFLSPDFDALPPIGQFQVRDIALDLLNKATPFLIADVLAHIAANPEQHGLDDFERMFNFAELAANVRAATPDPSMPVF